ncbi:hypothetical protein M2282_005205 [Variovorax boronicumulans]|uniref:hypothetical protein n=1 Tax=Variovorax boronicumulans TaxID=436515 RepID=UPI0024735C25|nr:hypothetical protein [Variovorax boronicumulans]MDH6170035.1 hypothetical protein [Variovorax boronicumulans]
MPMDFLMKIEKAEFPLKVDSFDDINNVLVLKAAGLVDAEMLTPQPGDAGGRPEAAIVIRITPVGRVALERKKDCGPPSAGH